jgi:hypothetical protein
MSAGARRTTGKRTYIQCVTGRKPFVSLSHTMTATINRARHCVGRLSNQAPAATDSRPTAITMGVQTGRKMIAAAPTAMVANPRPIRTDSRSRTGCAPPVSTS